MKRIYVCLILILPALISFQCEEDNPGELYNTNLVVSNESSFSLLLETSPNTIFSLPLEEAQYIAGFSSEDGFIKPSAFTSIDWIKLYKKDKNENLTLVYEQNSLNDELWIINQSLEKNVDHVLIISDEDLSE